MVIIVSPNLPGLAASGIVLIQHIEHVTPVLTGAYADVSVETRHRTLPRPVE